MFGGGGFCLPEMCSVFFNIFYTFSADVNDSKQNPATCALHRGISRLFCCMFFAHSALMYSYFIAVLRYAEDPLGGVRYQGCADLLQ